jgi:hypothetical protein
MEFNNQWELVESKHQTIGFPKIDDEKQYKMLIDGDYSPIYELVPEVTDFGLPISVIKKYITISKLEFQEYILQSNILKKYRVNQAQNITEEGLWILPNNEGEKLVSSERDYIFDITTFNNDEDAAKALSDNLWLSVGL